MKKLILFLLVFVSSVFAKDLYLDFYAFSKHFNNEFNYNEKHDYIGVSVDTDYKIFDKDYLKVGFSIATFDNSYHQRTFIAASYIKSELLESSISDYSIKFGSQIDIGFQHGYCDYGSSPCTKGDNKFSPYIVPSLYTEIEKVKLNLYVYPGDALVLKSSIKVYEF